MSKIVQEHYNIDRLLQEDADIYLIVGEKSNGKSFQAKNKCMIDNYLNNGKRFVLTRRWETDMSNSWITQYFADVDVASKTKNKYTAIIPFKQAIYFANFDEKKGRLKPIEKIGYIIPLSLEQHYSSGSYLDVDTIVFEEFMERGVYAKNEPSKIMALYSTIDRKRGTTKLILVGNTISRVCPYIIEWELDKIFRKMKPGDIETITIHNERNDVKLAIEYCKNSGGKTMAIGSAKSMIDGGAWQTIPQPHLPKSYKYYKMIYRIGFEFKGFRFLGEYLKDNETNEYIWFIYPKYDDFKNKTLVITDTINQSIYYQRNIYDISIPNRNLQNLLNSFRESKIFYADDLTGTEFKACIDFKIKL